MRRCAFPKREGFTLLELSIAMSVAGVLVALLVAAWVQACREGIRISGEAAHNRSGVEMARQLQHLLESAVWSATSIQPQGVLKWESGPRYFTMWSRDAGGMPGPARWRIACDGRKLVAQAEDPMGQAGIPRVLDGIADLRLDVAQQRVDSAGESLSWISPENWDPSQPFRPVAFRIRWLTTAGDAQWVEAWP